MIRTLFFCLFSITGTFAQQPINYLHDVKPILDHRCTVCHSCYNSPCQLKLDAYEGIDRGASKKAVYLGTRLQTQDPTRLFIDAQTTEEWRKKEFFSVTDPLNNDSNKSIMARLLVLKHDNPTPEGSYYPESEDLVCVENATEVERYIDKHPHGGMPFGFPPLPEKDYRTLIQWLSEGINGPTDFEQVKLLKPSDNAAHQIRQWESFLNQSDPKYVMSARYLFDHLFLAHIHFEGTDEREFYEIVRSKTPSPEPIEIIPTVRPYDDPGVHHFYYRFRKIHSTIAHKTHMIFPMSSNELNRIKSLFIGSKWLETPNTVPYGGYFGANPFAVYAQIPPKVRYQFLLDHAHYIVDTFIRGPVCKGQIALNVIEDHFWMFFMDPEYDLSVQYPGFLLAERNNLRLPTENGSGAKVWNAFSDEYRDRYTLFFKNKMRFYTTEYSEGIPIDAIWKGNRPEDAPALSIYRHFDSASVHRGVLGGLPKTVWVIDYPQFERIYYALVAGFDVFGNVSHQTNVRRYMDYLRMEGEMNFLQFLPEKSRYRTLKSWYIGDEIKNVGFNKIGSALKTAVKYTTDDPKREFVEQLVDHHLLKSTQIKFDPINYFRENEPVPVMPSSFLSKEDYIQGFRSLRAPGTAFIREFNEYGIDVLHLRIRNTPKGDRYLTIVINRWHDNVNALFMERSRLDPSKDTMEFFTQNIGSYPNYFFDVEFNDLPDFLDMMANYNGSSAYNKKIVKYGINRSNPKFWEVYDDFQAHFNIAEPMESGLYDLNRYYHKAF